MKYSNKIISNVFSEVILGIFWLILITDGSLRPVQLIGDIRLDSMRLGTLQGQFLTL